MSIRPTAFLILADILFGGTVVLAASLAAGVYPPWEQKHISNEGVRFGACPPGVTPVVTNAAGVQCLHAFVAISVPSADGTVPNKDAMVDVVLPSAVAATIHEAIRTATSSRVSTDSTIPEKP